MVFRCVAYHIFSFFSYIFYFCFILLFAFSSAVTSLLFYSVMLVLSCFHFCYTSGAECWMTEKIILAGIALFTSPSVAMSKLGGSNTIESNLMLK